MWSHLKYISLEENLLEVNILFKHVGHIQC